MRLGIACIVSMGFGLAGAWIAPPTLAQDLALRAHVQKNADSIAGHYWLGNICESVGDLATAREAFAFFEPYIAKWQADRRQFTSAEDVTLIGRGLDRWASLSSAYQTQKSLHN